MSEVKTSSPPDPATDSQRATVTFFRVGKDELKDN